MSCGRLFRGFSRSRHVRAQPVGRAEYSARGRETWREAPHNLAPSAGWQHSPPIRFPCHLASLRRHPHSDAACPLTMMLAVVRWADARFPRMRPHAGGDLVDSDDSDGSDGWGPDAAQHHAAAAAAAAPAAAAAVARQKSIADNSPMASPLRRPMSPPSHNSNSTSPSYSPVLLPPPVGNSRRTPTFA